MFFLYRRTLLFRIVGVIAAVALVGLTAYGFSDRDQKLTSAKSRSSTSTTDSKGSSKREQASAVAEVKKFVEQTRKLQFNSDPVVHFVDDEDYDKAVESVLDEKKREYDRMSFVYRAMSVIESNENVTENVRAIASKHSHIWRLVW